MPTFDVGNHVIIAPEAYTRAGESGVITILLDDNAVVTFEDGEEFGYLIDDGELIPTE